ncbi:pteridine reductase [Candidatus Methylopumilus turicensis]|jgi:pteridine reductase|uniref:Short-chain dehydrogenase/reductase SDR n=1 Tax=Candidatus Methylopumilus turicensis TaxID=1581680 RepID=A0A0B7IXK8_9PROT|nr:pteridine reductase [Candidatus Methylopumilus turicensis]CEN55235.1 Short-chain dehydrogenase/reductase SDR [Candidatus Methylopumilus turicensis]
MSGKNVKDSLQNKVILITGGAKRVGASICRLLHANGANLMIHYRSSVNEARALQAELNLQRPNSVAIIQGDLLNLSILPSLVQESIQHFGRLDVLINNASSYYPTEIGDIKDEQWQDLMGSNLKAPLFLAQAAADELRKQHGCIINITDMHVERPKKGYIIYSVAKAGLVTLTKSLAHEFSPDVRVNAVAPGPVMWPEDNPQFDELYRQRVISQTLLKRIGEPNDIAKAVKFLIQDAPFITGQIIAVDGGRSLNL